MNLSLCMIVRDEEENLRDCLLSLRDSFDEIIVVDTGSKDRTPRLAKEMGAKVFYFPWQDDFSAARNASLSYAQGDWIFWMDADDRITPQEAQKIRGLIGEDVKKAFSFKVINEGTQEEFYQLRLFPKLPGVKFEGAIHEQVEGSLRRLGVEVEPKEVVINHLGYADGGKKRKDLRNLKFLKEWLNKHPRDFYSSFQLASTYDSLGERQKALELTRKLLENPRFPAFSEELYLYTHLLEAKLYYELGEEGKSMVSLHNALQKEESFWPAKFYLGELLCLKKNFSKALPYLQEVKKIEPKTINLPLPIPLMKVKTDYWLGICYEETNQISQAIGAYQRCISHKPDSFIPYFRLGKLFLKRNRKEEAMALIEKSIEMAGGEGVSPLRNLSEPHSAAKPQPNTSHGLHGFH